MADLIDRDALLKKICGNECGSVCNEECENVMCNYYDYIMDAPAVNLWIPVEEALPEDGQRVLICSKSKRLFDVVFRANAQMPSFETKVFGKVYAWYYEDVIKWMPLPEPPEKEQ